MKNDNDSKLTKQDEKDINQILDMKDIVNVGTEDISQEDLNTPILKIIQSTTQDLDLSELGKLYRSDTQQYVDTIDVNLVCLTTEENENYNKTAVEKVKVYYGFYAGTTQPFKLYIRGWSIGAHRYFQTEIQNIKNKFKIPMFALTINISTDEQKGTMKDSGKPYTTFKYHFDILKDPEDASGQKPLIELNKERQGFLFEAALRFKEMATTVQSQKDADQGEPLPWEKDK